MAIRPGLGMMLRRARAKEWKLFLETGQGKGSDSHIEPSEVVQPRRLQDF